MKTVIVSLLMLAIGFGAKAQQESLSVEKGKNKSGN